MLGPRRAEIVKRSIPRIGPNALTGLGFNAVVPLQERAEF
jgi:hypothetical protein